MMLLSIKNAPLHFQRAMKLIKRGLVDIYVLIYLDDIYICSAMAKNHTKHVRAVFEQLAKSKFYLKCKKYTLFLLEVEFIGHLISEHRVQVLTLKVSSVYD